MKIGIVPFLFFLFNFGLNAQIPTEEVYTQPQELAQFNGGEAELMKFLATNLEYPAIAVESNISGTVYVSFHILKDGHVSSVEVKRGVEATLDREAVRVVKLTDGQWAPAKVNGSPVASQFMLPIRFALK